MDLQQYVQDATRTESDVDEVLVNRELLINALKLTIVSNQILEQVKNHIYYKREFDTEALNAQVAGAESALANIASEQNALDNEEVISVNHRLLHSMAGLSTEAGEMLEPLVAGLENKEVDEVNIQEEFGDVCWFMAIGIDALGADFEKILHANINKLRTRYPDKFKTKDANERQLDKERVVLEEGTKKDE